MKSVIVWALFGCFLTSCAHQPQSEDPSSMRLVQIRAEKPVFTGPQGSVSLGGLSGLYFAADESRDQSDIFYAMTDRGPNGETSKNAKGLVERPFLFPAFTPQILKISYDKGAGTATVVDMIPIQRPDGKPASGLPNVDPLQFTANTDEVPVDEKGQPLPFDAYGLDTEGLVKDEQGNFWICEEYGPSLLKVSPQGRILRRWTPHLSRSVRKDPRGGQRLLPAFLGERKENRGFEAIAWTPQKTLLILLQSSVPSQQRPELSPVLEFDPVSEKPVGLYYFPLDSKGGKIGGAAQMPDGRVLVVEQNGKTGAKAWQRLFAIDWSSATNLIEQASKRTDAQWLPADLRPVAKTEIIDLTAQGLERFEKLEGVALTGSGEILLVNDNDFGLNRDGAAKEENYLISVKNKKQ